MRASKMLKVVLFLGIALRVVLWCFQADPNGDDGARYLSESINMVKYHVFSTVSSVDPGVTPVPSAHDLPLWPSIMAVVYWLTDSVQATQYIAGAINIVLVLIAALFLIAMLKDRPFKFTDAQTAVAVAVLLFMPESVMYSLFHMPDQIAVTMVIVGLRFYFKSLDGNWKCLLGCATAFLAAIYSKPICIPLTFALLMAMPLIMSVRWKKRVPFVMCSILVVVLGLFPWTVRNRLAFGTSGLTSISGTNLYGCNWGRLVDRLPAEEKERVRSEMKKFENEISGVDLMKRSKMVGKYARDQILAHLHEYGIYTLKTHPRLYAGTGTVAMFRYLGAERICDALDTMWGSGMSRGKIPHHDIPYSTVEKSVGASVQILSWIILGGGYILVFIGFIRGWDCIVCGESRSNSKWFDRCVFLLPILSLLLLAAVIGPITATRYRFIMIPFFSMLAGYAAMPRKIK